MKKVWRLNQDDELYTDHQIKKMIKEGKITKEDLLSCDELKKPVRIEETIYSVFLKA